MEYSPRNNNPYVSRVDAGTVELIRSYGVEVVSSGDLIQQFEATWDDSQWAMHREAATHTDSAFRAAWTFIADRIRAKGSTTELDVQSRIMEHFAQHDLVTDSPPIVAVWEHAADPHFSPSKATNKSIEKGSFVLIDLWAKLNRPRAVYSDLTRVAYVGDEAPLDVQRIFAIVREARDAAIERVRQALGSHQVVQGWQVDAAARAVIERAGYGDAFTHRTGHSIGEETHGNGANIDGLETKEDRTILRQTGFSIEPGIYLPGQFGIRSEVNVYIDAEGQVHVTGGIPQTEVQRIAVE
jgi:Xaa-Pro aminopeptidase